MAPLAIAGEFWGPFWIAVVGLGALAGMVVWADDRNSTAPLALAVAVPGIVFFFGVMLLVTASGSPDGGHKPITVDAVRHGIAAGFLAAYFTLIGIDLWGTPNGARATEAHELGRDHFTGLMKIVLPFYFGAEVVNKGVQAWKDVQKAKLEAADPLWPRPDEPL